MEEGEWKARDRVARGWKACRPTVRKGGRDPGEKRNPTFFAGKEGTENVRVTKGCGDGGSPGANLFRDSVVVVIS